MPGKCCLVSAPAVSPPPTNPGARDGDHSFGPHPAGNLPTCTDTWPRTPAEKQSRMQQSFDFQDLTRPLGDVTRFSVLRLQRGAIAAPSIWGQAPNACFWIGSPHSMCCTSPFLLLPHTSAQQITDSFLNRGGREAVLFPRQALTFCRCLLIKISLSQTWNLERI